MIFVAVVEGHSLVRAGLRMAIDAEPDLQVTVDCASAAALPKLLARRPADVVLLDYDVSGVGGSEAVGLITRSSCHPYWVDDPGTRSARSHRPRKVEPRDCQGTYGVERNRQIPCQPHLRKNRRT